MTCVVGFCRGLLPASYSYVPSYTTVVTCANDHSLAIRCGNGVFYVDRSPR